MMGLKIAAMFLTILAAQIVYIIDQFEYDKMRYYVFTLLISNGM